MNQRLLISVPFRIRQILLFALLFMMLGTTLELYLLDHYEDWQQLIPLGCIAASSLGLLGYWLRRTLLVQRLFMGALIATAISGVVGVYLHLSANLEFEQEMKPTAAFGDVFWESLSGALPTLAPASMIVLAFIGYSYLLLIKQSP